MSVLGSCISQKIEYTFAISFQQTEMLIRVFVALQYNTVHIRNKVR